MLAAVLLVFATLAVAYIIIGYPLLLSFYRGPRNLHALRELRAARTVHGGECRVFS